MTGSPSDRRRQRAIAIAPQFDYAANFSGGLAAVKVGNHYGYISKTGKWVIDPQYNNVGSFSEGWAWVEAANQWRYVNKMGDFLKGKL